MNNNNILNTTAMAMFGLLMAGTAMAADVSGRGCVDVPHFGYDHELWLRQTEVPIKADNTKDGAIEAAFDQLTLIAPKAKRVAEGKWIELLLPDPGGIDDELMKGKWIEALPCQCHATPTADTGRLVARHVGQAPGKCRLGECDDPAMQLLIRGQFEPFAIIAPKA